MRSRLLRICLLALAAFAVMPGTAMALNSATNTAVDSNLCWTGQCPDVCAEVGHTWQYCVLLRASA